ncbi:MAG: bacteriohemerythrin [Candidatus Thorarchaeota archaeon]|nr:MAG: bacteriohemerythrin [Candidatus Thorarchaeota archaeon]
MTKIEWEDSLSIGVDLIDEQHKMLIKRIKDLSDAVTSSRGAVQIGKTLGFMIDYTEFHFSAEEKHMKEMSYPGLDLQIQQHEEFKSSLKHMVTEFEEDGATAQLSEGVNTYLINWLVKHIKSIDSKFGEFLREKGLEG